MSLFLFKPHVEGHTGNITTPDIVIDRVFLDAQPRPVNLVSTETVQQVEASERSSAAYALIAAGGGTLIGPAVLLSSGRMIVARKAWRLNSIEDHVAEVTLNGVALKDLAIPEEMITKAGVLDGVLPRGYLVLCRGHEAATAEMFDPIVGRRLTHYVTLESVDDERWGVLRPKPRYSVGPTMKEVEHYI